MGVVYVDVSIIELLDLMNMDHKQTSVSRTGPGVRSACGLERRSRSPVSCASLKLLLDLRGDGALRGRHGQRVGLPRTARLERRRPLRQRRPCRHLLRHRFAQRLSV